MHLHEYQAKHLLAEYGISVPSGRSVGATKDALNAARELGGESWVVKGQVHAGGRGKAGGVKIVHSLTELQVAADQLLGTHLVTPQTNERGLPINTLLIEQGVEVQRELYLGILVDRSLERVVVMASSAGGMDIEEVAMAHPQNILAVEVDPAAGSQAYQCRRIAFGLGLQGKQVSAMAKLMMSMYRLFVAKDLSLLEINPLAIVENDELVALDAKVIIDDNALYRQVDLAEWRDATQEDEKEHIAHQHGLNYVALNGNIGCMVNGAGLAMATMDLIKLHGGEPANFLDVGGGTTAERVADASRLILSDPNVKALLVNIFGGIVRCDLIAKGIIQGMQDVGANIPVVVRLEGTNVDEGRKLLESSGLEIIAASDLTDAAKKVVRLAK